MVTGKATNIYASPHEKCPDRRTVANVGSWYFGSPHFTSAQQVSLSCYGLFHQMGISHPLKRPDCYIHINCCHKICCSFGVPDIVHSDQGKNTESHLFYHPLGSRRVIQQHIIHRGMVWLKDSTASFSSCCAATLRQKMTGNNFCQCWCLHIAQLYTHSSTKLSTFEFMFGRPPCTIPFQTSHKFDTTLYASYLKAKLQTMQDFVQAKLAITAKHQK